MKKPAFKKTISNEDLARMVKVGFDSVGDELKEGLKKVNHKIDALAEQNAREHEQNTREHEEIKLRLDNVAYRFELVELQKRVEILEQKLNIRQKNSC